MYQLIAHTVGIVAGRAEARGFCLYQQQCGDQFPDLACEYRVRAIGFRTGAQRKQRASQPIGFFLLNA